MSPVAVTRLEHPPGRRGARLEARPRQSLSVLLIRLEILRTIDERQQEGEVLALALGNVVLVDGARFHDEGAEQVRSRYLEGPMRNSQDLWIGLVR